MESLERMSSSGAVGLLDAPPRPVEADASLRARRCRRWLDRFRRAGCCLSSASGVRVERATSVEDLEEAYRLVHDAYVVEGYIYPSPSGIRMRVFEALPEMATFVVKHDGHVVAVTSVIPDSRDLGLPSDHSFGPELNRLRRDGGKVCEITNLAVAPEYRNTELFLELTRACLAHACAIGCDDMFIAISPGHARFFEDVLQFDPWGDRRSYSDQIEDIVEGKRLNLRTTKARAARVDEVLGSDAFLCDCYYYRNPYHRYVRTWQIVAERLFGDPLLLHELFIHRSGLLQQCSVAELSAIFRRWGIRSFAGVCPVRIFSAVA